jgi:hypothetical protein
MLSPQEVKDECECDNCVGCAWSWLQGSFIRRGRILASTDANADVAAHELGHVIGLAHIISAAGVRPPFTMGVTTDGKYSPRGQLDVLEPATIRMLETLYAAGLTAGSSRRQFEAAGFVPPESESAAALAEAGRRATGYVVGHQGEETIVIRRIPAVGHTVWRQMTHDLRTPIVKWSPSGGPLGTVFTGGSRGVRRME